MTQINIQKQTAFSVKGDQGTYTIKPVGQMSVDEVEALYKIDDSTPLSEQAVVCRNFLNKQCPEIGKEGLGDMGYIQIVRAYLIYSKNGYLPQNVGE